MDGGICGELGNGKLEKKEEKMEICMDINGDVYSTVK